jgi:hypothetical protein
MMQPGMEISSHVAIHHPELSTNSFSFAYVLFDKDVGLKKVMVAI